MRSALKALTALLFAVLSASSAEAAAVYTGGQQIWSAWQALGQAPNMSVSSTSSNEYFGTGVLGPVALVCNIGNSNAWVLLGTTNTLVVTIPTSTPVATAGQLILAGMCAQLNSNLYSYISAITQTGTTTLSISLGAGSINLIPALSSSAGAGVALSSGSFTNYSEVIPTSATTIWTAATTPQRVRVVMLDTAILSATDLTVAVWCAWGTAAANAAVIGSNGFPLNAGFDDSGAGVNQGALNCIQSAGKSHYVRLEVY